MAATEGFEGKRVLAVYGHPDDEGQATGSLAAFLAAGSAVTLLCATRGEVGEISDPALSTPDTLGYTRELELRAAMAQLGLRDVRFLPFRDSGMDGTEENKRPDAFHQQTPEVAVPAILQVMREVRPHFVFTWQEDGGYGHPDHIAAHKHTLAAFDGCADAALYPETGTPWQPERLFWGARTMARFVGIRLEMEKRGLLDEPIDDETRARFEELAKRPAAPASVIVDTSAFIQAKRSAASMHRTQFGENGMWSRIPEDLQAQFYGEERFYQARPAWPEGAEPTHSFA
ncbi:MAG: PIG-L family deacetylase [Chloroflexi bacterium]|nr:PIG-L family deacetylase [Chloroflexota bacterium]MDA1145736.1 PIG-L family deacetylase [Chloroflexota bacterium]